MGWCLYQVCMLIDLKNVTEYLVSWPKQLLVLLVFIEPLGALGAWFLIKLSTETQKS